MPALKTNEWKYKKLSEICDFKGGGTPSKQEKSYWNGNIPWASVKDIKGSFLEKTQDKISISGLNNSAASLAKPGDLILITRISPGKSAISKIEVAINQDLKVVTPKSKTSPKFLHYFFQSIERKIQDLSSGTTVLGITLNTLNEIQIPDITYDNQLNIVSQIEELFSELDKGIENLRLAQQQLKVYRQSVLKWAFEGRLTNENVKEGELPEGWNTLSLNEVCKIVGGVTKGRDFKGKKTIQLPYLRVANVQDGYLDLDEIKNIEVLPTDLEKYKLEYGDILYTEGGDKDKLGRGTIWKDEIKNCIHQNHIFRARLLSKQNNPKYITYFSQSKQAKKYFFKHGKQTTNLASINMTILSNLQIPFCKSIEQEQIVNEIESRLSVADKMEESINQSLQQTEVMRRSVLKRAFEGNLIS